MCSIDFRLDDLIITQTREYTKIPEVFAVVGGYMNLITTIFTLLSILVNRLYPQLEILNGIFNFNLKKNKMTLKIYSIKDFNSNTFTKNFIFFSDKEVVNNFSNKTQQLNNNNKTNLSKNSLIVIDNNNSSVINIFHNKNPNLLIKKKESQNRLSNIKSINSFNIMNNMNNRNNASSLPYNNNGQTIYDDNSRISNSINDMKVSYIYIGLKVFILKL
jgi:hypothetical protein